MASMGEVERKPRQAELDGVRGVAIALVIFGHAFAPQGFGAFAAAGVTLFFALSGYLITGLLMAEHERTGQVSLWRFYSRRLTRLGPPLLVMLVVTGLIMRPSLGAWLSAATWTGNYAWLGGVDVAPYGHTWSLAVEEQFYIVWPLTFLGLARLGRARGARMLLAGVVILLLWRLLLSESGGLDYAYGALETAGVPILGGCLVALRQVRLGARTAVLSLGVMVAVASWAAWLVVPFLVTIPAVTFVAAAGSTRWLAWRPLTAAGVVSYSVYLWHEPVSHFISGELALVGVTVGVAVGLLAYRFVEVPVMRWREQSTPSVTGKRPAPVVATAARS